MSSQPFVAPTGDDALRAIEAGLAVGLSPLPEGFVPPTRIDPNYVPENRGKDFVIVSLSFMTLTLVFFFARMTVRARTIGWWWDDWLLIPAAIFCAAEVSNSVWGALDGGIGKHSWAISYPEMRRALPSLYLHLLLYVPAITFVKLSVLLFLKRLAGPTCTKKLKWSINGLIAFTLIFNSTILIVRVFQCIPVRSNWDLDLRFHPDTKCKDYGATYFIGSAVHVASDFAVLIIPVCMVWDLNLQLRKKVAVVAMLTVGAMACAFSLARIAYIAAVAGGEDVTWAVFWPTIFGELETMLAIICACSPPLRPVFAHFIQGLGPRTRGTSDGTSGPQGVSKRSRRDDWSRGAGGSQQCTWNNIPRGAGHSKEESVTRLVDRNDIEMMVRDEAPRKGIIRTVSVDVSYDHVDKRKDSL